MLVHVPPICGIGMGAFLGKLWPAAVGLEYISERKYSGSGFSFRIVWRMFVGLLLVKEMFEEVALRRVYGNCLIDSAFLL